MTTTGLLDFARGGVPDVLKNIAMVADTKRERITTSFVGDDL
jgi:hypothetical protein